MAGITTMKRFWGLNSSFVLFVFQTNTLAAQVLYSQALKYIEVENSSKCGGLWCR